MNLLTRKPKPTAPAEVIDLRDHQEARTACPGCQGTSWTERLGAFHCDDCGFRVGDTQLPPI